MAKRDRILFSRFTCCIFCEKNNNLRRINNEKEESDYLTLISKCFNIEMQIKSDKLKICLQCIERLKDSYDFKCLIEHANALLKESQIDELNNKIEVLETESTSTIEKKCIDCAMDTIDVSDYECNENTISEKNFSIDNSKLVSATEERQITNIDISENRISLNMNNKSSNSSNRLPCKMCTKTYGGKDALQQHLRSAHKGIKPFLCPLCHERFSSCSIKNKHMFAVHNWKSRVYPCTSCDKTYFVASDLYKHIEMHHNDVKNFTCHVCRQQFYSKRQLKSHEISHSDKKNFGCNICEKAFLRKACLKKHLKIHENVRDFECEYCGKTFVQKWSLQSHLLKCVSKKIGGVEAPDPPST